MDIKLGKTVCCDITETIVVEGADPMVLSVRIPRGQSTTIELPINFGDGGSVTIDWGDGTVETYTAGPVKHTYLPPSGISGRILRAYTTFTVSTNSISAYTSATDAAVAAKIAVDRAETVLTNEKQRNPSGDFSIAQAALNSAIGAAAYADAAAKEAKRATVASDVIYKFSVAEMSASDSLDYTANMYTSLGLDTLAAGFASESVNMEARATTLTNNIADANEQAATAKVAGFNGAAFSDTEAFISIKVTPGLISITYGTGSVTEGAMNIVECSTFGKVAAGPGAFYGTNIDHAPYSPPSTILSLNSFFRDIDELAETLILWGPSISNVEDIEDCFNGCFNFNSTLVTWEIADNANVTGWLAGTITDIENLSEATVPDTVTGFDEQGVASEILIVIETDDTPDAAAYVIYNDVSYSSVSVPDGSYNFVATVPAGFVFNTWEITGGNGIITGGPTNTSTTIYTNNAGMRVKATYTRLYEITVTTDGTPDASAYVLYNEEQLTFAYVPHGSYNIVATVPDGYRFNTWEITGDGTIDSLTELSTTLNTDGGDITVQATYTQQQLAVQLFSENDVWTAPSTMSVSYIIVGGGGGGGAGNNAAGGGGGGGGMVLSGEMNVTGGQEYIVIVGEGGSGALAQVPGGDGTQGTQGPQGPLDLQGDGDGLPGYNSSFGGIDASGGGGGWGTRNDIISQSGLAQTLTSPPTGGYGGGDNGNGGGGGGATANGMTTTGGAGFQYDITESTYGDGGNGGTYTATAVGAPGTPNKGNGGGGGSAGPGVSTAGGNGGSGFVALTFYV